MGMEVLFLWKYGQLCFKCGISHDAKVEEMLEPAFELDSREQRKLSYLNQHLSECGV